MKLQGYYFSEVIQEKETQTMQNTAMWNIKFPRMSKLACPIVIKIFECDCFVTSFILKSQMINEMTLHFTAN